MYILGLTGSIAMGKSTVLAMFRDCGVPVYDADEEVRTLLRESIHLKKALKKIFPEAFEGEEVNRVRLAGLVFKNEERLRELEAAIHPIVMKRMARFIKAHGKKSEPLIVLDIPLLFETGAGDICDGVAVVSAPPEVQKKRALERANITGERLSLILSRQLPDEEKRKRADFIISTGGSLAKTRKEVEGLVKTLTDAAKKGS